MPSNLIWYRQFLDIKTPNLPTTPDAVVIVATLRALKMHGGVAKTDLSEENVQAVRDGFANLKRHVENVRKFGLPAVVAINEFIADTEDEIAALKELCAEIDVPVELASVWANGADGGIDLANAVVDAVENGFAVLESIKKEKPDVILMDIRMPEMDGVYCTKAVKEKYPDIKIIILTTFDDDEFVFSALKYGASGYLLKGVSMDELYRAICTVYNGGAMINPDIATKVFKLFSKMSMSNYAIQVDDSLSKDLTQAELKVIQQVGFGLSNKEIAQKLFLSEGTVRNYVSTVLSKLALRDRTQLAIWAVQTGVTMQEFGDESV